MAGKMFDIVQNVTSNPALYEPVNWLRGVLAMVTLFNIWWTAGGVVCLARGCHWPSSAFRAAVFMCSTGTFLLQLLVLTGSDTGATSVWACVCLSFMLFGNCIFAYARLSKMDKRIDKFFQFYPNVDLALPVIELASYDPESAEKLRQQAVKGIVSALMENTVGVAPYPHFYEVKGNKHDGRH